MRVVFDTNIFVSALIIPGGNAEAALIRIIENRHQLALSKPIIEELLRVLAKKFHRSPEELARLAVYLSELAHVVVAGRDIHVLEDERDNRILECAVEGRADLIVTGDSAMLRLGAFRKIRIVSLREYLACS